MNEKLATFKDDWQADVHRMKSNLQDAMSDLSTAGFANNLYDAAPHLTLMLGNLEKVVNQVNEMLGRKR